MSPAVAVPEGATHGGQEVRTPPAAAPGACAGFGAIGGALLGELYVADFRRELTAGVHEPLDGGAEAVLVTHDRVDGRRSVPQRNGEDAGERLGDHPPLL